ncbi:MAG: glutamate 5-kinase [Sulfurimonas sp. RIFCSPHIGHO2_12_FULL_36_9]|uniref:glutamate 5-kinase n=1 Tax=Sulfurimonas sp. RIFCSPLOWO2_12_36_12 TaxID=1802253 RepID=UPI0008BF8DD8|nr:glutamate 5-kinase [Sulfurimonas sp. RIFCSPLOWO2_12_36_12]OHD97663.1 MAG: glutamate 5-kinase [Sulfurimonas sp. RIFCSPHIGHO2_12_FULL_36_9]OHD98088.1 MAG: glutamate 5-kinase [Sulfurimonas sp. RIFCSPLOWO2_02_FULL_36_28]OHE01612.1 MAG: glutamate 5-kinase [Sulfurimonas sp. RIFCSPLOWO2_12_36_12]OHE03096.1 MAG: glutamate 5-kinase [Sulfurimonas sp. RIFCSPLOWO2_12_FULL_36_74]
MRRVVVKVGSAVLTQNDAIALERMKNLVDFLAELRKNNEVILVSSGAVAAGYTALKLDRGILQNKQALASIGQPILMNKYAKKFAQHNILTAQVLVTAANFNDDDECRRIKDTVDTLLSNGVIPIINENDATTTKELVVGDNDQLSAYVAKHTDSNLLIILSDIDAYYDKDPRKFTDAKILRTVNSIDENELQKEATPNCAFATGGILTKLKAANYLLVHGIDMVLTSGYDLSDIKSLMLQNRHIGGTIFTKK